MEFWNLIENVEGICSQLATKLRRYKNSTSRGKQGILGNAVFT